MKWHVKRNGSLHANVLALTIAIVNEPRVSNAERLVMRELAPGFWCGVASYGFMERPNIPQLLQHVEAQKCGLNFDEATYYLGHETVVRREATTGCRLAAQPVRADGAQRHARHGLLLPAQRSGGGDQPPGAGIGLAGISYNPGFFPRRPQSA